MIPNSKRSSSNIIIPTLPGGSKMSFHLLSTWGDPNYIGLAGI
jgi:hypothetical protein